VVVSGVAGARTVSTGSASRVQRERNTQMKQIFYAVTIDDDEVELIVYPNEVQVGQHFDIVDDQGLVGRVRIDQVRKTNDNCPRFTYIKARAKYLEAAQRTTTYSLRFAVGPAGEARMSERAQMLLRGEDDLKDLPPPGESAGFQQAVDLDGDGDADAARYIYDCAGGPQRPYTTNAAGCIDDYARDGAGAWTLVQHGTFRCY
jgi:hypothetical protein